jgi:hypothetical protein
LRVREHHAVFGGLWPDEATALKPLGQQLQFLAIEPLELDQAATAATEHKHMPREGVGSS